MKKLFTALACSLGFAAGAAHASPITIDFTYSIDYFSDYTLNVVNVPIPGQYSGWYSWDVDLATVTQSYIDPQSGYSGKSLDSSSGCIVPGQDPCVNYYGPPVTPMTNYAIETPWGLMTPHANWNGADFSFLSAYRQEQNPEDIVSSASESWNVGRVQQSNLGDPLYTYTQHAAYLFGYSTTPGAVLQDIMDLTAVPTGPLTIQLFELQSGYVNGVQQYTPNMGFVAYGTLSSVTSTTSVPEPATLALFSAGLFGIALSRRRRRT